MTRPSQFVALLVCAIALTSCSRQSAGNAHNGEAAKPTIDSEYRRLDQLASTVRARNAQQYAITSPRGIDESMFVQIGGIDQWVTIRGQDRANPVLLFLHGGPGDVTNPWSFAVFAPWEKYFTVVQWDQRGAGRTLKRNGPQIALTITTDRMVQDGIELVEYLCRHLGKEKVVLVGHSFGSILGVRMARSKPSLFYAYVGTGQVADATKNDLIRYTAMLKKATATDNQPAMSELKRIGPPPYDAGLGYSVLQRWANSFEGADEFLYGTIGLTLVAPGNSVEDMVDSADGQNLSAERLVPETKSIGPEALGLNFSIPMFVFQGEDDFTTSTVLADQYLKSIKAPRKEFVTIKGGGHFAVFMRSDQFLNELTLRVRPLALR
jgi:pimeloyl-ACP methyl ester carboxylesterase